MSDPLFERYKEALKAGHVAALRGRLDDALVQYRRAAAIADERALPHASMGSVLLRMGRVDESLAAYHRALDRSPRDEQSLGGLAEALVAAGRSGDAADALERFAEAVQSAGRAAEALAILRRALALNETERRRRHVRAVERLVQDQEQAAAAEEAAALSVEETAALSGQWTGPEPAAADQGPHGAWRGDGEERTAGPAGTSVVGKAMVGDEVPVEAGRLPDEDHGALEAPLSSAAEAVPAEGGGAPSSEPSASAGPPIVPHEAGGSSGEAERAFARAESLAAEGREEAVAAYLEAAAAYLRADAPAAAEDACQRALVLSPASVEVHLAFVRLSLASGGRDMAADKLALLGRLLEFDQGPEARVRVLAVARESFPDDPRFSRPA